MGQTYFLPTERGPRTVPSPKPFKMSHELTEDERKNYVTRTQALLQDVREDTVRAQIINLVREDLKKCARKEGVNHPNCRQLARMLLHLQDMRSDYHGAVIPRGYGLGPAHAKLPHVPMTSVARMKYEPPLSRDDEHH